MRVAEAYGRLKEVQEEFDASTFAVAYAIRSCERDPTILGGRRQRVRPAQLRRCINNLGVTYVVRQFAEFEAILRDYLAAARHGRRGRTSMETLMDRIAAIRTIRADVRMAAHAVRNYRNGLLHNRAPVEVLTFDQCKTRLTHFLSFLPPRW